MPGERSATPTIEEDDAARHVLVGGSSPEAISDIPTQKVRQPKRPNAGVRWDLEPGGQFVNSRYEAGVKPTRYELRAFRCRSSTRIKDGCMPPHKPINSEKLESASKLFNSAKHAK